MFVPLVILLSPAIISSKSIVPPPSVSNKAKNLSAKKGYKQQFRFSLIQSGDNKRHDLGLIMTKVTDTRGVTHTNLTVQRHLRKTRMVECFWIIL